MCKNEVKWVASQVVPVTPCIFYYKNLSLLSLNGILSVVMNFSLAVVNFSSICFVKYFKIKFINFTKAKIRLNYFLNYLIKIKSNTTDFSSFKFGEVISTKVNRFLHISLYILFLYITSHSPSVNHFREFISSNFLSSEFFL